MLQSVLQTRSLSKELCIVHIKLKRYFRISRAIMRINGRVICGNRSQTWELLNVPFEISTILDEFHVSKVQWPALQRCVHRFVCNCCHNIRI
jgi:hypothetical protein